MSRGQICRPRVCYACGSIQTYIRPGRYAFWYLNHDEDDSGLCRRCFDRYIHGPKQNPINAVKWRAINNHRRIKFAGRLIFVDHNPRIGVCNWCRAVMPFDCKKTHIHHDENKYDSTNPLRNTIEICPTCHTKETVRLTKLRKLG
jgi:hypothetical protein